MSWWSVIPGVGDLIRETGEAFNKNTTTDAERNQHLAIMEKFATDLKVILETQMTERWKADMASDSWLSKNIRPGTWLVSTVVYQGLLVLSAFTKVPEVTLDAALYGWMTVTGMYIPMREGGKLAKLLKRG